MSDFLKAMEIYTSAIMSQVINAYWLYKGDASTEIEAIDKEALFKEMMRDARFLEKVLTAILKVGMS